MKSVGFTLYALTNFMHESWANIAFHKLFTMAHAEKNFAISGGGIELF